MLPINLKIERKKIYFSILYSTFFVVILFFIWLTDTLFHLDLYKNGIAPRELSGLKGIITAPLIHGDFSHWANNAIPLFTLGIIVCYFYRAIAFRVFISVYFLTGLLVWLFARGHTYHIGASGLVYSFVAFVFVSGLIRKNYFLFALSALVLFLYSGLFPGIFPIDEHISWESHLIGSLAGIGTAFYYRNEGPADIKHAIEQEEDDDNDEGEWKNYPPEGDQPYSNTDTTWGPNDPFPPFR